MARGLVERAVRLLGAADMARETLGLRVTLNHGLQRRTVEAARAALSEVAYATAWTAGRGLSMAQAIREALADPTESDVAIPRPAGRRRSGERQELTAREREVLRLLITGLTDKQIADTLFISHRTAQVHVAGIFAKLGVTTRTAAATAAHRLGLDVELPHAT
jgi:DNA-binding NarL/FixJ family response regulator